MQRFADEHPEIARRVFANIAAVVPRTHAGERLLIWGQLRRLHPAAADGPFESEEVRHALRNVRKAQWCIDHIGSSSRHSHAAQIRELAMSLLGEALNLSREEFFSYFWGWAAQQSGSRQRAMP